MEPKSYSKIVLRYGQEISHIHVNSIQVKAVYAHQIDHVLVKHENNNNLPQFKLEPQDYTFTAQLLAPSFISSAPQERFPIAMKAMQLPLICNVATTCHKLQGSERENYL